MANITGDDHCQLSIVGHLVGKDVDYPHGEVRITDGTIVEVRDSPGIMPSERRIDVGDAYVLPGVIDPHVHSLSDPSEGLESATRAAAAGGVTTILEMPFDAAGPIWTVERMAAKKEMVASQIHVDTGLFATVRPHGGADQIEGLAEAGAVAFKISTYHTDPNRFPRTPDDEILEVFRRIAATGRRCCVHAENDEIVRSLIAALHDRGTEDPRMHCTARPPISETAAVANTLELARDARAKVHFVHMSLPHSIDLVRSYAKEGDDVSAEACPHYLLFNQDDMLTYGPRLKVNPPLRTQEDVDGLWDLLRADEIDAISSDHAPWAMSHKNDPNIFDNASGAPGVETMFPVVAAVALHDRGVSIQTLVRAYCWRTAELFGISHRKGDLKAGLDGDVTVFDPNRDWTVDEKVMQSHAGWSPFDGMKLHGRVTLTVSRGQVVFDGEKVLSTPGQGHLVGFAA